MILDIVVSPPRKHFCDLSTCIAKFLMWFKHQFFFPISPSLLIYARIEMIMPSMMKSNVPFPTLLTTTVINPIFRWHSLANLCPVLCAVSFHQCHNGFVFLSLFWCTNSIQFLRFSFIGSNRFNINKKKEFQLYTLLLFSKIITNSSKSILSLVL